MSREASCKQHGFQSQPCGVILSRPWLGAVLLIIINIIWERATGRSQTCFSAYLLTTSCLCSCCSSAHLSAPSLSGPWQLLCTSALSFSPRRRPRTCPHSYSLRGIQLTIRRKTQSSHRNSRKMTQMMFWLIRKAELSHKCGPSNPRITGDCSVVAFWTHVGPPASASVGLSAPPLLGQSWLHTRTSLHSTRDAIGPSKLYRSNVALFLPLYCASQSRASKNIRCIHRSPWMHLCVYADGFQEAYDLQSSKHSLLCHQNRGSNQDKL